MRLMKRIARGRKHQHWAEAFMATFIMLTRLSHGALKSPEELEKLERKVVDRITAEIPEVEWSASYATLGPYDYVDIFQAPDVESATKVATIVRTFGHAHTETWAATDWQRFKAIARDILPLNEG
jgi:uncharacterized protein with GYD domain